MPVEDRTSIVLVLGADDNYARPLAVTLYSALTNLDPGWTVDLYLIDGGIHPANKARIEQIASEAPPSVALRWKTVDASLLASLPQTTGEVVNDTTYLRLFIPDLVPDQHQKAIYLDCDLIIRSSLSDLWTTPFNGNAVLAVQDYWIPYVSCDLGIDKYDELDIPADAAYFNAGVLVMNLPLWRRQPIRKQVTDYLITYEAHRNFNDQEGLNAVLADSWHSLPLSWNVPHIIDTPQWTTRLERMPDSPFKRAMRNWMPKLPQHADIIHYASASKPWKSSSHYPLQRLWYSYFWNSSWLGLRARLQSQLQFYMRYYPRAVRDGLLNQTRAPRHRLAEHLPSSLRGLLRR
jgi:lipopolysaccharide biosynthesis glycosyltransferase